MNLRRRSLLIPALLAGVTTTLALAQDSSSSRSERSDRSSRSDRSDHSSRSDRSDRESRRSERSHSGSSSSSSSFSTTQPATFLEGYRLVLDRNIFSRNRVIYREPSAGPTTVPSGSSFRSMPALSLTGVTKEGEAATAFIEDRRSNATTFYHVGDAIADGKITAINLDSIEYVTAAGKTVRVDLGQALEAGPTYSVSSSSSSYAPSGVSSGTSSAPASSGESNDILERLRQKRLQETKR